MINLTTKKKAIEINHASLKFGNKVVLDDISIDFHKGELTALLGPNGTGKSTLLKVMTRELASHNPKTFSLSVFDKPVNDWQTESLARHLGVLPQSSSLTFNFTVQEVVELGAIPLSLSKKETEEVAKKMMIETGVEQLAQHNYPNLSGGEKQRVHLARVLTQLSQSGDDKIILLDEPTSALDIEYQHKTLKLAKSLAKNGVSVVIVIHDLNLASQYADRIVMLNRGKVAADGTPWQVLTEENIWQVYNHKTMVIPHPELGVPLVV
ncbi:heme ABC transporter ATP-binding protein [Vibrio sp. SS-MA-C1-2]|uniref:heme ABC transporter ATP-binding protein n=1 Tax=Vibrio sp. SS-MA-C1-2 TaxID=2908646 RepID=UPI001F352334|nr:heme ABC transporter ATP-binding protein [Vibrio sp. SS-MA-C1-2]UJF17331.1 heme ABC transporter ATP-binding protein [Vibrio sp. SS-MA-C1-2]